MIRNLIVGATVAAMLATAVPALAETSSTSTVNGSAASINTVCVQAAVDMREQSIGTAWTTFSGAISSALSARASALHSAWGMSDAKARRAARNAAWSAYNAASKAAHTALKASRKSAWDTFKSAAKTCGVSSTGESLGQDRIGSIAL